MRYEVVFIRALTGAVTIAALYALQGIYSVRGTEYAGLTLFPYWFIIPVLLLFSIEFFRAEYKSRYRTRAALTLAAVNLVILVVDMLLMIW